MRSSSTSWQTWSVILSQTLHSIKCQEIMNENISLQMYIDQILKPVAKLYCLRNNILCWKKRVLVGIEK